MGSWTADLLANGIKVDTGSPIPVRKEIRELSPEELFLFLDALYRFQKDDGDLSFYQIAGIHGQPYNRPWPRWAADEEKKLFKGPTNRGFCTHSSIIFLTWHRPYLALFESRLHKHAQDVAADIHDSVPNKADYITAAQTLRLPFWDWALPDKDGVGIFPKEALSQEYPAVRPKMKDGAPRPTQNPLYNFEFPRNPEVTVGVTKIIYWSHADKNDRGTRTTERRGNLNEVFQRFQANPDANPFKPQSPLSGTKDLSERVLYILKSYSSFGSVSHNAWHNDGKNPIENVEAWGSLEGMHNSVHNNTGGHMGDPDTAAFDPIFWLHHNNIDRLMAIWQALHQDGTKDSWVTPKRSLGNGNLITPGGNTEGPDTDLLPFKFKPDQGAWYKSTQVKDTRDFGYTFEELRNIASFPAQGDSKKQLLKDLDSKYLPLSRSIMESKREVRDAGIHMLESSAMLKTLSTLEVANTDVALEVLPQLPAPELLLTQSLKPQKPFLRDLAPDNKYLEWLVNIKAKKYALDGRYAVHVFLNAVQEEDVSLWTSSPYHVGIFAPFGQPATNGCGKCQQDQTEELFVTGQIPLTVALVERYLAQLIPDITPATVTEYLKTNLHWRVELDGESIDRRRIDGLLVVVTSNEVTLPDDEDDLPIYAPDVVVYPEITTKAQAEDGGRGEGTGYVDPSTH